MAKPQKRKENKKPLKVQFKIGALISSLCQHNTGLSQ